MESGLRRPRDGGLGKKAVGKSGLANTFAIISVCLLLHVCFFPRLDPDEELQEATARCISDSPHSRLLH